MRTTRRSRGVFFLLALAGGVGIALAAGRPDAAAQPVPAPAERPADRDAVTAAVTGLAAAFKKGDAKAVAAHWAADGEYVDDEGTTFRGRAALEKEYAAAFAKSPGNHLEVEVDTVRFPSRDTAVVEGHFKLRRAAGELVVSRCSLLFAREDGKWLIAIAREWPGDGLSLRDLEFLIGRWEAKRDGTAVSTRYEWTANKSFIRCHFSVTQDGKAQAGTQMIGKDPATGALRVWTFEDAGGIGDTDITRDGKKWVFTARGVTAEGRVVTATNLLTPVDGDTFLWHPVQRALDGEPLPDLAPVRVTRVKDKP
jgi:uncharacterized protein (TIGR02246 family)